jgi:threonine aldolase
MRQAMAEAIVGDDVFGEDPTVNRLEQLAADTMGKAAALFVSSGTMANLISQMVHCQRGNEMILGNKAHSFNLEQGGSAAIGGIHPRTVPNRPDGSIDLQDLTEAIRPTDLHCPRTRLIVLENTHNLCSGSPLDLDYLQAVRAIVDAHELRLHIDGARIFNAATALDVTAAQLAQPADSISFCLSKALAAPVGSLVCGSQVFIDEARRMRKVLGGGMRQAGVLAAAGIVALNEMIDRLAIDHANARHLAQGLARIDGIDIDPEQIKSNIVFFDILHPHYTSQDLIKALAAQGIRMLPFGPKRIRAVTHYHITAEAIDHTLQAIEKTLD